MIDTRKFEARINLLKDRQTLMLRHHIYGEYKVRMNPPQNRVYIDKDLTSDDISESDLMALLVWDIGEWFVYEEPDAALCKCCNGRGTISTEAVLTKV